MTAPGAAEARGQHDANAPSDLDLRVHTPGLTDEEIAAVTSVVSAMLEEQRRDAAVRPRPDGWRHSLGPLARERRSGWDDRAHAVR